MSTTKTNRIRHNNQSTTLRNLSWNVNGILRVFQHQTGVQTNANNYPILQEEVKNINPDMLLLQEHRNQI